MDYNILKNRNGNNFTRNPHTEHISRRKINGDKIKKLEESQEYGEIPRKIAKICGVKNLNRATQDSVDFVMNISDLVQNIKSTTNSNINEILGTLSDIRRRETLRKNRSDRFKILERSLTINYFGEDYWLEHNLEEFVGENKDL